MSDLTIRGWFENAVSDLADGAFALLRMTKQRALHVNLRDDSGAELGTVANPINTTGGGGGGGNVNVAQIGGTAQSGANVVDVPNTALRVNVVAGGAGGGAVTQATTPWVDNITQFGSSNVVTGTGIGGAGIPRVTVSSDSFPASQAVSGTIAATQSGGWTSTVTQATGSNLHTVIDSGTVIATQATGTNLHVVVDSAPSTVVSGTVAATQGTSPWVDNLTQVAGTALGATAVVGYGSTPAAVNVPAVNAFITNTPAVTLTSTTITGNVTVQQSVGTNLHTVIDSGTTVVTQATGANLHVVVDTAPTTTVTGTVAVSNTSFNATGTSTPTDATSVPTTAQLIEAFPMMYNGVGFDMQRGDIAHGVKVSDPAMWQLIGLTRQMLMELRGLRLAFSTVSGTFIEDDDLELTVQ